MVYSKECNGCTRMVEYRGDAERLASEAMKEDVSKSLKLLSEASEASLKLLEDSYKRGLEEAERRLLEEFSNLNERVKSLKSKLDFELRSRMAEKRNKFIEAVLAEVRRRLKEAKDEDWYKTYMESVFRALAVEARELGALKVMVAPEDLDLAKSIASRYPELLKVSREPVDIIGGVIAESQDGTVKLDYSLDLIISRNEAKLRYIALKALIE
ncbi:MAG: V-type ATP synthase subunit E family protein [Desulfurococcales archaeon]|jgi:V/A-type H+-transporting ATPase subunit E|nr:V-type ATP synthase subunit E family protein [Desulfurococcales archaeon]